MMAPVIAFASEREDGRREKVEERRVIHRRRVKVVVCPVHRGSEELVGVERWRRLWCGKWDCGKTRILPPWRPSAYVRILVATNRK